MFRKRLLDVPMEDYLKWDALSASLLKDFIKCPLRYHQTKTGRFRIDTDALRRGRAFHSYLEGPHAFTRDYVVARKIDRRTKAGKEEHAAFCEEHDGKVVLTADEFETVERMAESVLAEPKIRCWIERFDADREVSYRWEHPETGLHCKCRPDLEIKDERIVLDYKTAADASPDGFARAVRNFGYDTSAVHYQEGTKWERYGWIVVESKPPYAACLYWLHPSIDYDRLYLKRQDALERLCEMLEREKQAQAEDRPFRWPSYENGESTLVI